MKIFPHLKGKSYIHHCQPNAIALYGVCSDIKIFPTKSLNLNAEYDLS